jgi:ChpA-C
MHQWTVRAAQVALFAAAVSAAGAGVANADNTSGDYSILGGNQFRIPIIAPIGLFGNHVNLLSSGAPMGYRLATVPSADPDPVYVPQLDICGNAISNSGGVGTAACKGQAKIGDDNDAAPVAPAMHAWAAQPEMAMPAIGAPNSDIGAPSRPIAAPEAAAPAAAPAKAPAAAPVIAPAKAPAAAPVIAPAKAPAAAPAIAPAAAPAAAPAIDPAAAPAAAPSDAPQIAPPAGFEAAPPAAFEAAPPAAMAEPPAAAPAPEMITSGENGVLSGNQVKAPVRIPIRVCGNAGALGGMATATCEGTSSSSSGLFAGRRHAFRTLGVGLPG